jgi:probable rRNA maturation factor
MEIQIQNRQRGIKPDLKSLKQTLGGIAVFLGIEDKELSILLVNDKRIAQLNRKYRHRPEPTDVLAFAMQEGGYPEFSHQILGDVVISVETAQRQAQESRHSLTKELQILIIHGILHLLGYDHQKPVEAERMHLQERRLIKYLE